MISGIKMEAGKNPAERILYFLSIIVITAFLLTLLFFPYASVIANRYLQFGFHQTVLFEFFRLFIPFLQIGAVISLTGFIIWKMIRVLKRVGPGMSKKTVIGFFLTVVPVIAAGTVLSAILGTGRGVPVDYSATGRMIGALMILIPVTAAFPLSEKKTPRRAVCFFATAVFLLSTILFVSFNSKRNSKTPNVVFIVVDTLRNDHTSLMDPEKRTTGYLLNSLLPDSFYFRKGYSNSPWTLPSVSSLMTSKYPSELGIFNLVSRLDNKEFTIAELMREEGYSTGAIISHILLKADYGISQGFDVFNDRNISGEFGNHIAISSPGVSEDAVKFIRSRKDRKFFLLLHYFDPHYIYLDHEKSSSYQGKFRSKDISFLRDRIRNNDYSHEDTGYLKYCYDSEIRFTDFYVGKVIEELKNAGLYDDTIIIFTSDHGEEFIERGWLGHSTTLYGEQTGVPILIKPASSSPRLPERLRDTAVSNIDLVPTLVSMLGIKRMPGMKGADLMTADPENHTFFGEVSQKELGQEIELVAVNWNGWKMILDINHQSYELYNISDDPDERRNVIRDNPDISSKLKMKLQRWLRTARKPAPETRSGRSLSESEREKLKTLGYIN